jgi:hypothetical protein
LSILCYFKGKYDIKNKFGIIIVRRRIDTDNEASAFTGNPMTPKVR